MAMNREGNAGKNDVQIYELTMDNNEDQDELNRRLRKPGEPECGASAKLFDSAKALPIATEAVHKSQGLV